MNRAITRYLSTRLAAALAPVCVLAATPALAVVDFTVDPGWTSSNTTGSSYNFGYSGGTSVAGGITGEGGGTFTRFFDDEPGHNLDRYYGDTNLVDLNGGSPGDVDLTNNISASGKFDMTAVLAGWADNVGDTGLFLGHFSSSAADGSLIGFALRESGSGSPSALRLRAMFINPGGAGTIGADVVFDPGEAPDVNHTFSYTYDPVTDVLDVLIDGVSTGPLNVPDQAVTLDAFGMGVYIGQNSGTGSPASRTAQFFIDDVDYTGQIPEPASLAVFGLALPFVLRRRGR